MEESGQSTASQALLFPTRLKMVCLPGELQQQFPCGHIVLLRSQPLVEFFHFTHCSELATVISKVL